MINTRLKPVTTGLIGAVGLGVALLGIPEGAKAAPSCGPGDNWIATCQPGSDILLDTKAYLQFDIVGQGVVDLVLGGDPVTITRGTPVDSIVGDSDFAGIDVGFGDGNVGITDGERTVIKTRIEERFTFGDYILTGTGAGAIVQATDFGIPRPDLAWSFFTVFAEIEGPFGKARNQAPIIVEANNWLVGVSPQQISPIAPPPALPSSFVGSSDEDICQDPLAAILYCGFRSVDFFLVNDNGDFIDSSGNPATNPADYVRFGELKREIHSVPPIPEPSTVLGLIAVGLSSIVGFKGKKEQK